MKENRPKKWAVRGNKSHFHFKQDRKWKCWKRKLKVEASQPHYICTMYILWNHCCHSLLYNNLSCMCVPFCFCCFWLFHFSCIIWHSYDIYTNEGMNNTNFARSKLNLQFIHILLFIHNFLSPFLIHENNRPIFFLINEKKNINFFTSTNYSSYLQNWLTIYIQYENVRTMKWIKTSTITTISTTIHRDIELNIWNINKMEKRKYLEKEEKEEENIGIWVISNATLKIMLSLVA